MQTIANRFRVCFIGDSITTGTGDQTMLGWPGRVCAAERAAGYDITMYNLGVRGDTSADVRLRWKDEAARRLPAGMDCVAVFAFGLNDSIIENGQKLRMQIDEVIANSRDVITQCKRWVPTLFVGPAPVDDTRIPPQLTPGLEVRVFNHQLQKTNRALGQLLAEENVPYLDVFSPLMSDPQWSNLMREGDGVHPTAKGYDVLANLFHDWTAWRELLGKS